MIQSATLSTIKRWLVLLSLVVGVTLSVEAESVEIDGLYYELNTSTHTATLTYQTTATSNYATLPANLIVPSTVIYDEIPFSVTAIADRAFANCTTLESISIPATVTSIGTTRKNYSSSATDLPFFNCTSLKTVRLEDGGYPISLGASYSETTSGYRKGLFFYAPLEEVYLGRNITYSKVSNGYDFEEKQSYYGYSAFYNQPKLAKITIGQTVTEIPDHLFYGNASITLMALPNVELIGKAAFRECSKLTTLDLGNTLTSVGDEAFYNCPSLTKLTLPNTTQYIGANAFYNCSSVTEVTVGSELKSIGANSFYGCKSFTALILPDSFTTMGESAFEDCTKLTVAKLGLSLTELPAKAFKNCTSLSEMVIPASVESIGSQALYNDSGLATVTMNEGLKAIGDEVFWNNSGVMQFSIPGTVTTMGRNCFYGCTGTTYLTFREGSETLTIDNSQCRSSKIDERTTNKTYRDRKFDYFYDCPIRFLTLGRNIQYEYSGTTDLYDISGASFTRTVRASAPFVNSQDLRSVTIGPNVTFLYHHLFDGCANLSILKMGQNLQNIYSFAFQNCGKLSSIKFPEPLKLIDNSAFRFCDELSSAEFQESSTHTLSINDAAFESCKKLSHITLPGQLDKLGIRSFSGCDALKDVIFYNNPNYQPSLVINDNAFEKCKLIETLSFPGRLTSIGNFTFTECDKLVNVRFEESHSAVTLGYGAADATGVYNQTLPLFGNCNLQSLYLGRNVNYKTGASYGYSPFYHQTYLTDIKFSDVGTVTYCGDYLLYCVNNCENIELPESITSLGIYTLAEMTKLNEISIPTKVSWLKEGLLSGDTNLTSIIIHPAVNKIDTKVFANCESLASATFEGDSDILEIGYGASESECGLFFDCPLETLNINRWLSYNTERPERSPFYSIATLKNLTFGEHVGVVDKYMFTYCTGLEEVYLPDNIKSVGMWGFRGCTSLKNVRFSQKLSQVGDYGFSECSSLDNVVFPESMTSIADNSFSNCLALKKLDLGKALMIIGPAAFKNDSSIEGIEIPETLYGLGVEAFANCTSLPNVAIKAISSIGRQAFQNCSGLQWVSLSDKTTSLGENSFAGCTGIKYVKSYAELPPEGLVNFVDYVPAYGTLFVPENSLDYYQYSPTWETWLDIRPLSDNIMISSITLNKSDILFKATETVQLSATVGTDDATDKGVLWKTSDSDIATVDTNGLVTAVAVGEATISAVAADGSGITADCHVVVSPTMVESITITPDATTIKKGRQLELTPIVAPKTATDTTLIWSSSNEAVATVNSQGIVSAIAAGNVEIISTANDGSGAMATVALTIVPPTKGDSNDDDRVTITDAVNTANYAMGYDVENFCREAADVNGDNYISIADASGTVSIVLSQPVAMASSCIRSLAATYGNDVDMLIISDFNLKVGEMETVAVRLDNTHDYVAMQGDIIVPEGLKITSVKAGSRMAGSHSIATKRQENGDVRFIIFDLNNSVFADNDEAILELTVISEKAQVGGLSIANILASDSDAKEYALTYSGGNSNSNSGIETVNNSNISIKSFNGKIFISNAEGKAIEIVASDGSVIAHFIAESSEEHYAEVPGVYIVSVGNIIKKVIVK